MPRFAAAAKIDAVSTRADALDQFQLRIRIHQGRVDRAAAEDEHRVSLPLRKSSFADIGTSETPSAVMQLAPSLEDARRVHLLRQEELARPGFRHLARAGKGIADDADDVIVVENSDLLPARNFHLLGKRTAATSTLAYRRLESSASFGFAAMRGPRVHATPSQFRKATCPISLAELRRDLAAAYRIVANEGVLDAFGHISLRHPGNPKRYFLSRSRAPALVQAERHPRIRSQLQSDRAAEVAALSRSA